MKKFFYLLLALPLAVMAWSCSDDDDKVPNVDLSVQFNDQTVRSNGELYVVQGDTIQIESISLVNNTGKNGAVGATRYFWDGINVGYNPISPYNFGIATASLPVGRHILGIDSNILVVDYPVCFGIVQWPVNIVASADDMPSDSGAATIASAGAKITSDDSK